MLRRADVMFFRSLAVGSQRTLDSSLFCADGNSSSATTAANANLQASPYSAAICQFTPGLACLPRRGAGPSSVQAPDDQTHVGAIDKIFYDPHQRSLRVAGNAKRNVRVTLRLSAGGVAGNPRGGFAQIGCDRA